MGTTIDDVYVEMAYENEARKYAEDEIINDRKILSDDLEQSKEIFDYLPIRKDILEDKYINHLWDTFLTLDAFGENGRPFSTMPFHLLFMLTIQYKVLRIAKANEQASNLFFSGIGGRNKKQLLSDKKSVFVLALINERTIPEFFQLIDLDQTTIRQIKRLVDNRNNNFAHAKGGIEPNLETKIKQYIDVLQEIQKKLRKINLNAYRELTKEIDAETDIDQLLESRFLDSNLAPKDFGEIILNLMNLRKITIDQFRQLINKGLSIIFDETLSALKRIAQKHTNSKKRFIALEALNENDAIDEELKSKIIEKETNSKIKLFLRNQ